jgi:tetratricopeptide (TPR) repeat protein
MDEQKSKQNVSTTSKNTVTTTIASSHSIHPRQRMAHNYLLIWIDASIDDSKQDCQNTLAQLRSVVNDVKIFTQRDEGIDFLTEVEDMKAFLILEGTLGSQIVQLIHDIPQLDTVYIFCDNKSPHEQWTTEWAKIKGVHTQIETICEALQLAVKHCNQDTIAVSFVTVGEGVSNASLNQLEPTFMYTQIFKEILLQMEHGEKSFEDFILFWRKHSSSNTATSNVITEFERDYCPKSSIRWYTRESFVYEVLNRALRKLEADTIINMGFFIRDLHQQLEELHQEQVGTSHGQPFILYRGQGLSKTDFEKLLKSKGGLMSFNNFLSTSPDRNVSLFFAESVSTKADTVGTLFKMSIDPSVSSAPFASIRGVSYFHDEEETLFSMHTVFRVGEVTKMNNNNSLYQVNLTLTADDDQELRILTDRIREEVKGETGWKRLGQLLLKLKYFNRAEELYTVLLEQTSDEGDKASYYHQLGHVKEDQGDYEKAIEYYEKAHEIKKKTLPSDHPTLATFYSSIAAVYQQMGEYSKAAPFYEKALEIFGKTLPPNHPHLAAFYNNVGEMYQQMGEYSKAAPFCGKALEIRKKTLPQNHPDLASSYNNIAGVYQRIGEYSKAVSFYEKAHEICKKTLPPDHPDLATSYNNIAAVYQQMGEYSKAFSFYEKAHEINEKTLPSDHPTLATSYGNIAGVYQQMGEYSKALSFYEKALEILKKTLFLNHPSLAISYNNIGELYQQMGEYSKALPFYEKALEIKEKNVPPNSPHLAISYNNIGNAYSQMREYSKALSFYKKALEILKETLSPNHPHLASSYNNIGVVYNRMGEYSKALSFFEKDLEISQKTLPPNHPDLAASYNNIAAAYQEIKEYSKALSFLEKSHEICKKALPPNHPTLAISYNNIAYVYDNMKEYSKALSYFERALNIIQLSLPSNHHYTQVIRRSIERVKKKL